MTGRLPRLDVRRVSKVLKKLGFTVARQSGSHMIFKNSEGKRITLPYHSKRILHPKLLKSVLKDAGVSIEEFKRLLG
ncbi:MAG: type II toxin-antitoxin system HicA family toxin [Candidatus Altiarchaeota archaeon]|nr:type II toxin-antitoxin system HicA family toxin [Candidatus Altiarchaeota archaeon]